MTDTAYQILNHSFSIALEEDWHDQSHFRFVGPEFDGLLHYINITVDNSNSNLTVSDYAKAYLASLQDTLNSFIVLKRGKVKLFNNSQAYEIVYQWRPGANTKLIQRCVFTRKQQTIYILTASFTENSWKKLHLTIDNMMRSFH